MSGREHMLSSTDALKKIISELEDLLLWYKQRKSMKQNIIQGFSLSSMLPWPYILLSLFAIASFAFSKLLSVWFCSIILLFILIFNILLATWENAKKQSEITTRIQWCMSSIKEAYLDSPYTDCLRLDEFLHQLNNCNTSSIRNSQSHSISYVYRRNYDSYDHAVPIPTALLATGDVISLWVGQESPTKVECVQDQCCKVDTGEVLEPSHVKDCNFDEEKSASGNMIKHRFKVIESPVVEEIKKCLSSWLNTDVSKNPPAILFDRQRNFLLKWFLSFMIPGMLIITYIASTARFFLLPQYDTPMGGNTFNALNESFVVTPHSWSDPADPNWYIIFIRTPILMYIPFLPIILPTLLILLNAIGEAKTLSVTRHKKYVLNDRLVATPTTMSSQAIFFKTENKHISWWKLLPQLLWNGNGTTLPRNAGLFSSLGSLTVLCCIDKEGILSWFNPTTEKVFFFQHDTLRKQDQSIPEENDEEFDNDKTPQGEYSLSRDGQSKNNGGSMSQTQGDQKYLNTSERRLISETLTLSQDFNNQIQFDDVRWEEHLASLKPLGLSILLNLCTCTSGQTLQWTDHDSESSFITHLMDKYHQKGLREDDIHSNSPTCSLACEQELASIAFTANCAPPITSTARNGLCSLMELIGFEQDGVRLAYSFKEAFTAYKKPLSSPFRYQDSHSLKKVEGPSEENAAFLSSENLPVFKTNKWKYCLPHLHGTLVQDIFGDDQVLVYGTGDLVVEHCSEVWDGRDIITMSNLDRRKAVDFYQRSSMAGQCIAFAFLPLVSVDCDKNDAVNSEYIQHKIVNITRDKERKVIKVGSENTNVLNNLIFLGMTTLQYQARSSVCQLVDTLDRACIRFVYFSTDNEVRSQAFAEKMGLETGWNCHISLSSTANNSIFQEGRHQRGPNKSESLKSRSSSECGTHKLKTSFEEDEAEDVNNQSGRLLDRLSPRTLSESSTSDSLFNMSNRAKLPRGIQNIIPHIENVDNVPLLVPLFTDATPETAQEMIRIMQDNGEVVCCIGSSDCIRNMSVFKQANVSLAIEPLVHPKQMSSSNQSITKDSTADTDDSFDRMRSSFSRSLVLSQFAMSTARKLHVFPCSLLLSGDNSLRLINTMITQSRHFLFLMRISFIFLLKSQIMLTMFQLLAYLLLLPFPFTPLDIIWLSFIVLPCLSLSLLGSPPDNDLMTWANQKTLPKDRPVTDFMMRQSTKRYLVKFLPSMIVLLTLYSLSLHSSCLVIQDLFRAEEGNTSSLHMNSTGDSVIPDSTPPVNYSYQALTVKCYPYFLATVSTNTSSNISTIKTFSLWEITDKMSNKKRHIQLVMSCFLVLYLCTISTGYVHRWKRLINKPPYLNKLWSMTLPVLMILQVLKSVIAGFAYEAGVISNFELLFPQLRKYREKTQFLDFGPYQSVIWTVLLLWPVPCLVCNELWKLREIKMWNRGQKRSRADFDPIPINENNLKKFSDLVLSCIPQNSKMKKYFICIS